MSRLIDADELIKYIKIWEIGTSISSDQKEFIDCVNSQPTAFDLDKVVERLKRKESEAKLQLLEDHETAFEFSSECRLEAYEKAIEIVKGGGAE